MTTRYFITVFLSTFLFITGCSSWGGKMNNSEGVNYYSKGQYDQALSAFQTAARLNPEDSEVYYNIASTYQQQALRYQDTNLLNQAETNYRRCLEKSPTPETTVCCYRGLATVLNQKKDGNGALRVLKEWEDKEPTSVEPKLEIAYLLEAQGKNAESAEALTKIKDWAPNDYRAFYKLGLVKEKMGEDADALEQVKTAARLNPTDQEIARKVTSLESKINAKQSGSAPPSNTEPVAEPVTEPVTEPLADPAATPKTGAVGNGFISQNASPSSGTTLTNQTSSLDKPEEAPPLDVDAEFTPFDSPLGNESSASQSTVKEPTFVAPSEANLPSPDDLGGIDSLDNELPSYDAPHEETVPASTPVNSTGTALPDLSSVSRPASLPAVVKSNGVGDVTLPDGTGSPSFQLGYSGTSVKTSTSHSTVTKVAQATTASRKSKVGEQNPGPPRTSVGAPF